MVGDKMVGHRTLRRKLTLIANCNVATCQFGLEHPH